MHLVNTCTLSMLLIGAWPAARVPRMEWAEGASQSGTGVQSTRTARSAAATGWMVRELMIPRNSMDRYSAPRMLPTFWMVFLRGQPPF